MTATGIAEAYAGQEKTVDNRIIDVFHSSLETSDQERIISQFKRPDSSIRCIVSTIALGMGIDIPDVVYVFHWGPSTNVINYWQEVGRAGRSIPQAYSYLFATRADIHRCDEDMRLMCKSVIKGELKCLREHILQILTIPGMEAYVSDTDEAAKCHCCSLCCQCEGLCTRV